MRTLLRRVGIASALLLAPLTVAQATEAPSPQFINQPAVTGVETVNKKPLPRLVTWDLSDRAIDSEVTNDHVNVEVYNTSTDQLVCALEVDGMATEVTLTKGNCGNQYKVSTKYRVEVSEERDDESVTDSSNYTFETGPPKLKKLRVKNKDISSGSLAYDIKWQIPTNLFGEVVTYEYKITKRKNRKKLVATGTELSSDNTISISGLPKRGGQVGLRIIDSDQNGRWVWKKYKSPKN